MSATFATSARYLGYVTLGLLALLAFLAYGHAVLWAMLQFAPDITVGGQPVIHMFGTEYLGMGFSFAIFGLMFAVLFGLFWEPFFHYRDFLLKFHPYPWAAGFWLQIAALVVLALLQPTTPAMWLIGIFGSLFFGIAGPAMFLPLAQKPATITA
ncbi:MAG: hypothetical protein ACK5YK_01225 [Pseudomonadota bacterium]